MGGELSSQVKLYNSDGSINFGWSREPLFDLNLEDARFMKVKRLQRIRTKKWDYYYVFSDKCVFSAALVSLGYAGMVLVYYYDCGRNEVTQDMVSVPLASGFDMARNSSGGITALKKGRIEVKFDVTADTRHIVLKYPLFNNGEGIEADFILNSDNIESICVATPIEDGRMNYTHKTCCMPAEGFIRKGGEEIKLDPGRDLGGLDWSRGFLARNTFWNWACASSYYNGHSIGLNLCCGLNDTLDTENAFFIDGKCHKVDRAVFEFDSSDHMKPWRVTSTDNKVYLKFIPAVERVAKTDFKLVRSELHQVFGRFSGRLMTDGAGEFLLENVSGTIEDHHAKW